MKRNNNKVHQLLLAAATGLGIWTATPALANEAPGATPAEPVPRVQRLRFDSSEELENQLAGMDYEWPPRQTVPSVMVDELPLDLAKLPVARKKALFFRSLLPMVLAENQRLLQQRDFLKSAFADPDALDAEQRDQLAAIQAGYRVTGELSDPAVRAELLRRVDVVPAALVLAQAANESGWGTSRFAREANNLFGMWTYSAHLGLVPGDREQGARHRVRAYSGLRESVQHYMLTLNRVAAYEDLRNLRAAQRAAGQPLDAQELALGLLAYSERGAAYVEEIRRMIRSNRLQDLHKLSLPRTS